MLTAGTFTIAKPDLKMIVEKMNNREFKITAEVVNNPSGVSKVQIPVWSDSNGQDDLKWYTASEESAGRYSKIVKIADHKGDIGIYKYASYLTANNGIFIGSSENDQSVNIGVTTGELETQVNGDETEVKIILKDTDISGIGKAVKFAVWSEEGEQDDLKWYTASLDGEGN